MQQVTRSEVYMCDNFGQEHLEHDSIVPEFASASAQDCVSLENT